MAMSAQFAAGLPRKLRADFAGTMEILRDPDFLTLCVEYPRARQPFIVAAGVTDTVESEMAHQGRHRQGVQAGGLPAAVRPFVARARG